MDTTELLLRSRLRHCAEVLLTQSHITVCEALLEQLVSGEDYHAVSSSHPEYFTYSYTYSPDTDVLGALYQSLRTLPNRKSSGSYYTPEPLAKHMLETSLLPFLSGNISEKTFFDPSCGTGIFLMSLAGQVPLSNLYGNDVDLVAIILTKLNLAMRYGIRTPEELSVLESHFTVSDYISGNFPCFDIILGNPPWGVRIPSVSVQYKQNFFVATGVKNTELFDLFIEKSLSHLNEGGMLSFLLPEAILNVKTHAPARELLLKNTRAVSVEYVGDAFKQVFCPCIIFTLQKKPAENFYSGARVHSHSDTFYIRAPRKHSPEQFLFDVTEEDYLLLQQLENLSGCITLKGQADFALGIVTGDNERFLSKKPSNNTEPVLRGTDIQKYTCSAPSQYIMFAPEHLQQTAPEQYYRAPEKLFYRFIGKHLVFAYDNTGMLSLNSCNIVIPHVPGLNIKYILSVLNSEKAQFVFEKKYRSVKVLRSHIEAIPIPVISTEEQEPFIRIVDQILNSGNHTVYESLCAKLNKMVDDLYELQLADLK